MLYNKNQFKKLNDKKVLHKIKKHWVTVSVALLGLIGVKSVAMHANVSADTNVNADDQQANHQIGNQSIKSTASLVPDKGARADVMSTNASSSQVSLSSSANVSSTSAAQYTYNNRNASYSIASADNNGATKSQNVSSEAQQIHDHILNEFTNNASHALMTSSRATNHIMLGGTRVNNQQNSGVSLNTDMLLSLADANKGNVAYSDLMNSIGDFGSLNFNGGKNAATYSQLYYIFSNINTDLQALSGSGLDAIKAGMNKNVKRPLLSDFAKETKNNPEFRIIAGTNSYKPNTIASYASGNAANVAEQMPGVRPNVLRQYLSFVVTVFDDAALVQKNPAAAASYSHAFATLADLPNENSFEQASALNDVTSDIKGTVANAHLPNDDSYTSLLHAFSKNASQKVNDIDGNVIDSLLGNLPVSMSTAFNIATDVLTSNSAKRTRFINLINAVKTSLDNNSTANGFMNSLSTALNDFGGHLAPIAKFMLNNFYSSNSDLVNEAYQITSANASGSNGVNSLLADVAGLNSANATSELNNIHDVITDNPKFSGVSSLAEIANSASASATSISESTAYRALLNNQESTLFNRVINRINASGFDSSAFDELISNAEADLAQASDVSDFATSLSGQDGDFNGLTANDVKNTLNTFVNNPEFSNAYQAVRASSADMDHLLNDLSGMNSDNEIAKLSDMADITSAHFSDDASFGSLANDVANAKTSVANATHQTPAEITAILTDVSGDARDAAHSVADFHDNDNLPSNSDSSKAKSYVTDANDAADDAKTYAVRASEAATADTGVQVSGLFSDGTPDYVEDINRVKNDKRTVGVDLTKAGQYADESRTLGKINTMLTSLGITTIFNNVISHVVSDDDYNKLTQAVNKVKNAFDNNGSVAGFINSFNQIPGDSFNIKDILDGLRDNSIIESAYHQARLNKLDTDNVLNDLSRINQSNVISGLHQFNHDLTTNDTFNQLTALDQVAQVASDQADQINNVNSIVSGVITKDFVSNAVKHLVNEPLNKRIAFENLTRNIQEALNRNDSDVGTFINNLENDSNFTIFNGNDSTLIKSILYQLTDNSSVESIANGYYQQIKAQRGNIDQILVGLSKIAKHPYVSDADSAKSFLDRANNAINDSLQSIPGFTAIKSGISDAKASFTDFAPTKPSVQVIVSMIPQILSAITKPNFDNNHFDGALQAVEDHLGDSSLSMLWNHIKSNPNVTSFTNHYGDITNWITGLLSDNSESIKELNRAYDQIHNDPLHVDYILDDLKTIADNHLDGISIHDQNIKLGNIRDALNNIISVQINGDSTIGSVDGMDQAISDMNHAEDTQFKAQNITPSVESISALIPLVFDRLITPGFNKVAFQSAINATRDDIDSDNARSLSGLWNYVQNNSSVNQFGGYVTQLITNILDHVNPQLEVAYENNRHSGAIKSILTDLEDIPNHPQIGNNDVASANDKDSVQHDLNDIKSQIHDNADLRNMQGMNDVVNNIPNNYDPSVPDVSVINNLHLVPEILDRITAANFDSSDFGTVINTVKSRINQANSLSDLWSDIDNNQSGVKAFSGPLAGIINTIFSNDNGNIMKKLNAAYQKVHTDGSIITILNDLQKIADNHLDSNNIDQQNLKRDNIRQALNDIYSQINEDSNVNSINGMSKVNTDIQSAVSKYQSQVSPLPINSEIVNEVLNRLVHSNVDRIDFHKAVKGQNGIEDALASQRNLNGFLDMIKNNDGVIDFNRRSGFLTNQVMDLLGNSSKYDADYQVARTDGNVNNILDKLDNIAQSSVDNEGHNDQIDSDLNQIATLIKDDNQLLQVGGMQTVENTAYADDSNYQVVPHYADDQFNQALNDLINGYSIKGIADQLASKTLDSNEKSAFNKIIGDLKTLPGDLSNHSEVNDDLSAINAQLDNFNGPLSYQMAGHVHSLIDEIEAHDSTPDDLAQYADQLNNSNGDLINDLNKGMQDVKSGQNNIDYQSVLTDLTKLDNDSTHEDRYLKDIANVINRGGLKNIPLLRSVAHEARHVANQESHARKHAPIHAQHKEISNNHQKHINHINHVKEQQAKNQQSKDNARRNAEINQKNADSVRHAQYKADNVQHIKDVARHNRIEANRNTESAENYAKNAIRSATAAQSFASGLNSGVDSNEAYHHAMDANVAAHQANVAANQAYIAAHKAMQDSNDSDIINDASNTYADTNKALNKDHEAANDLREARIASNRAGKAPHYATNKFNNDLNDLISNSIVKSVADHLASTNFIKSNEKLAFNSIISNLQKLPNELSNHSKVNSILDNINSELGNFHGSMSHMIASEAQELISKIERHDSTPSILTSYADRIGGRDGNLINDLNKGMQDVKSGQNNVDYQSIFADLAKIDNRPKSEDLYLKNIANVIKRGNLKNIPLLKSIAYKVRHVADQESHAKKHAPIHAKHKELSDNHKKHVNHINHVKKQQAKEQQVRNQIHRNYEEIRHNRNIIHRNAVQRKHAHDMNIRKIVNLIHARHVQHRKDAKAAEVTKKEARRRAEDISQQTRAKQHSHSINVKTSAEKAQAKQRAHDEDVRKAQVERTKRANGKRWIDTTNQSKQRQHNENINKIQIERAKRDASERRNNAISQAKQQIHDEDVRKAQAERAKRANGKRWIDTTNQSKQRQHNENINKIQIERAKRNASERQNNAISQAKQQVHNENIHDAQMKQRLHDQTVNKIHTELARHSNDVNYANSVAKDKQRSHDDNINVAQIKQQQHNADVQASQAKQRQHANNVAKYNRHQADMAKNHSNDITTNDVASQANSAFGSASSAVALTRADDLFNDQIKAFDFASSAVNGINDEINVYNAEDAELSANSLNSSTIASFSNQADRVADSDINNIRQYNYYQDIINRASNVANVDVMSGDTLSDEEAKVDSWSANPIEPTLNFVVASAPHVLNQSKPRMLLGGMPMFGAESQSNDSFATSATSEMTSLSQAMASLSAANVTNRNQFNSYSNAINSLSAQTRANVNTYNQAQNMSQLNNSLITQGNSEKADAMTLHNKAASDSLKAFHDKVRDMINAMNEAKIATSTISKALNNAMIISSAKSASANINNELSQAGQAYSNASKLLSAGSTSSNTNNSKESSLYASEITSDSNVVTSYSNEANANLNNGDVANDTSLSSSANWCRSMMNSVAANMNDAAQSDDSDTANAANYDAIDAGLIAEDTYRLLGEAESSAATARSNGAASPSSSSVSSFNIPSMSNIPSSIDSGQNLTPTNVPTNGSTATINNNVTPNGSVSGSVTPVNGSISTNTVSNDKPSLSGHNRGASYNATPTSAPGSDKAGLRATKAGKLSPVNHDSNSKNSDDGNGQNGGLASNTDKGTSAPTTNGNYGTDPVEGTGDNENGNANDGRLPQTGESQNTPAMVIMALISLSAALIGALGYDFDKDRRHE